VAPVAGSDDETTEVGLPVSPAAEGSTGRPVAQAVFFLVVSAIVGLAAGYGRHRFGTLQAG
jgi:hypothetical protein